MQLPHNSRYYMILQRCRDGRSTTPPNCTIDHARTLTLGTRANLTMYKHKQPRRADHLSYRLLSSQTLQLLLVIGIYSDISTRASASSNPKNLVNLHHAPIGNLSSTSVAATAAASSSNQFQNEYQYRQSATKPVSASADRHKSAASSSASSASEPPIAPTTVASADNQFSGDLTNLGVLDYTFSDNRFMSNVPDCRGRLKLNGTRGSITDGVGHYLVNTQCTWLIDSGLDNATVRIRIHQFNTECNYDFLYIFDGDSIYSPLVAALSGDMKDFSNSIAGIHMDESISDNRATSAMTTTTTLPGSHNTSDIASVELMHTRVPAATDNPPLELETHSGKAFIYFHSDTAQSMPGFSLTYTVNSCPLDCLGHGDCDHTTMECKCSPGYHGPGCQYSACPNNCTSPAHGFCDRGQACVCSKGYSGQDCSRSADDQIWTKLSSTTESNTPVPARAFHQSIKVDNTMWVFGGKSQALSNTNMGIFRNEKTPAILAYDLEERKWEDPVVHGITNQDHLAELSGHSVAAHGNKVFIYGGMSMNNSILDTLSVFDTKTRSLVEIPITKGPAAREELIAPIAVTGHSASIVDGFMYIFMGYNPKYGHLNFAQKFNIANNSWSIIDRKGSSVGGCIGHTSTYDPVAQLVYIYGGHTVASIKSNKLYSFNPHTESWTYLLPGPSPRYYHSAIIMNGLLVILGGNSYNTSHRSDQCFQQTHLAYDLRCSKSATLAADRDNRTTLAGCASECWSTLEDTSLGVFKRHGYTVVGNNDNRELLMFGGFNAILMNDLRSLTIAPCSNHSTEDDCDRPRLGTNCYWNRFNNSCEARERTSELATGTSDSECSKGDLRAQQSACETRETCSDCLHTNLGCVWCGLSCHYNKCKSIASRTVSEASQCFRVEPIQENLAFSRPVASSEYAKMKEVGGTIITGEPDMEIDCKLDNCYLCQARPHCSWQNDACAYTPQNALAATSAHLSSGFMVPNEELTSDGDTATPPRFVSTTANMSLPMSLLQRDVAFRPASSSAATPMAAALAQCDVPCYNRTSCQACATTRCIWLSFTEQCIESSAYFAYQATGQCAMHYVAHQLKCQAATCDEIETCDKCLANPKCGWLNDLSNTGMGKCLEGNNSGPTQNPFPLNGLKLIPPSSKPPYDGEAPVASLWPLSNWFYTSCPSCQCNGHSTCKKAGGVCMQPCQDYTEGEHCERCIHGYFGDPINGGQCRACRCNGHANSCSRDTGKCYCSTKGIVGHNCNRCDDKNYYIGEPGNGTCYYNLTTDYQYTFNMSKPEDHFYDEINFINIPLRKDSDIDFSIACSRLALMNISSGTSYRTRRPIHSGLECGAFRLRFLHDRLPFHEANYSFFVHVYRFQTPFILQIAFSQHRTLYLPQFFFTVSSSFLFFFALSGVLWKLKHEYDLYVRRQRQFIEMEQMASRPFSTILLELFKPSATTKDAGATPSALKSQKRLEAEPTPISFEPCFSSNVGVVSFVVQLPGKPGLAIGSSLVELSNSTSASTALLSEDTALDEDGDAARGRHHHHHRQSKAMEKLNET